jgi:2-hydroxychromene-2-carboxylate isomerase
MKQGTLYTDFVSPFAYLAMRRLGELDGRLEIDIKPLLFAGLLDHWGQKGPAEIPAKKIHTFHLARWYAKAHGIDFRPPPAHPFNPLRALRLAIALGSTRQVSDAVFEQIWLKGNLPDDDAGWAAIQSAVRVADAEAMISAPAVKAELRANGAAAIAAGVFGVPTFVVDGRLFWGVDALDMLIDVLDGRLDPDDAEGRRIQSLAPSATRPGAKI